MRENSPDGLQDAGKKDGLQPKQEVSVASRRSKSASQPVPNSHTDTEGLCSLRRNNERWSFQLRRRVVGR